MVNDFLKEEKHEVVLSMCLWRNIQGWLTDALGGGRYEDAFTAEGQRSKDRREL